MSKYKFSAAPGWPFIGFTWDEDDVLYCKCCASESKSEHHSYCPEYGTWPSKREVRDARRLYGVEA